MRIFHTFLGFGGNLPPQLAVTRALLERGHEVRVLTHRAVRDQIESAGAQFRPFTRWLPDLDLRSRETDPLRDWAARTPLGAALRLRNGALIDPLPLVAHDCVDQLTEWPADVVIFDWLFFGAAVAAEQAGVPAVALGHCPYPLPVDGAPPLFSGFAPMRGPLGPVRDRILNRVFTAMSGTGLSVLNATRAEHGLAPKAAWDDQLRDVRAFYMMTAPELDFSSRAALPANVSYVGPAFEPIGPRWHSPWPADHADPLILITFSTTYMNQGALAQRVLDAVAPLPVRALLTTGPALDPAALSIPANVKVERYVPHRAILPHIALVITHAGWETINTALAAGVPLLCVPDARDQPDNAARVVEAGVGLRARKRTSPKRLRRLITRALNDTALKDAAQAMAVALAKRDGVSTIVAEIEHLGRNG